MCLDDKTPHYFEQIRRRGFKQESLRKENLFTQHMNTLKHYQQQKIKAVGLVPKGNKLMMRAVPGARFFVPETT